VIPEEMRDQALPDTLVLACKQIQFARDYTLALLDRVPDSDWWRVPPGAQTHIGWQVGHLAMAEYGLCLFRMRGRTTEDRELMPGLFRKRFSRGSTPDPDPARNPSVPELRTALDRVHRRAMLELPSYQPTDLLAPIDEPYAAFHNKLGGLLFCAHHEMIHAGQIGLLRRLLGHAPVR